ncbi:MAG TPA: hypothetical protein VHR47_14155, partial [Bacillota bacterium]|nr:hypothetical protein [Bacillota bacterium]
FNGTSWNGYEAETYKPAFIRIVKAIRAHHLEAATIWCAALPLRNYMDFYPGDEYVDWWGIDLFLPSELKSQETFSFLGNADLHGKPVIIGESTPRSVGVGGGQGSWNRWFKPYFNLIRSSRVIKAFCYINWNWANYPQWSDWGDARLETKPVVADNYCNEMRLPLYFHGTSEAEFRRQLTGVSDHTPPSVVTGLTAMWNQADCAASLAWQPAADDHGINRYEVFANGQLIGNSVERAFQSSDFRAGDSVAYTVRVVDSAGNPGPFSEPVRLSIPKAIPRIANGDFQQGRTNWSLQTFMNGTGLWEVIDQSQAGEGRWAQIYVKHGTGTNWHVQFGQGFQSHRGCVYRLEFTVRADAPAVMDVFLQQSHAPYHSILERANLKIGPQEQTMVFEHTVPADDDSLFLTFMIGCADQKTIWIKNVSLTESRL